MPRRDGGSARNPGALQRDVAPSQVRARALERQGPWPPESGRQPRALRLCVSFPHQSLYQRLSQRMLDISGDRGVLKDVIREGTGELVTPDASVLGNGPRTRLPSTLGKLAVPRCWRFVGHQAWLCTLILEATFKT